MILKRKYNLEEFTLLEKALYQTLDEIDFFQHMAQFLKLHFNKANIKIFNFNENVNKTLLLAALDDEGKSLEIKENQLEDLTVLFAHVIRNKSPYFSNNIHSDPIFVDVKRDVLLSEYGEISFPIIVSQTIVGLVQIRNTQKELMITQEDIAFLTSFILDIQGPLKNISLYLKMKNLNEFLLSSHGKATLSNPEDHDKDITHEHDLNEMKHVVEDNTLIGRSEIAQNIEQFIKHSFDKPQHLFLSGNFGVGKTTIAKNIHLRMRGNLDKFIIVNSEMIKNQEEFYKDDFEHFIIGHYNHIKEEILQKYASAIGGGTLYLNNVDRLNLKSQFHLLNLLKEIDAFDIVRRKKFYVRIISSSQVELKELVKSGQFYQELYFRLKTLELYVPTLKERSADIEDLALYFLNSNREDENEKSFSQEVMEKLISFNYSGNITELKSIVEKLYLNAQMQGRSLVTIDLLPQTLVSESQNFFNKDVKNSHETVHNIGPLSEIEKNHIVLALRNFKGNKTKTAKCLGITVKTLYNKLHTYGLMN